MKQERITIADVIVGLYNKSIEPLDPAELAAALASSHCNSMELIAGIVLGNLYTSYAGKPTPTLQPISAAQNEEEKPVAVVELHEEEAPVEAVRKVVVAASVESKPKTPRQIPNNLGSYEQYVVGLLTQGNSPMSILQIWEKIKDEYNSKVRRSTIHSLMCRLNQEGKVRRCGKGKYALPKLSSKTANKQPMSIGELVETYKEHKQGTTNGTVSRLREFFSKHNSATTDEVHEWLKSNYGLSNKKNTSKMLSYLRSVHLISRERDNWYLLEGNKKLNGIGNSTDKF